MPELSMVWYVEAEGASYRENTRLGRPSESYRPTGEHEMWLLDGGGGPGPRRRRRPGLRHLPS